MLIKSIFAEFFSSFTDFKFQIKYRFNSEYALPGKMILILDYSRTFSILTHYKLALSYTP